MLKSLGPNKAGSYGSAELDEEIEALKKISAHAVITTNYDEVIEPLFPEYERVIGQQILRKPYLAIGEIFKVHGCRSDPKSIVINEADYQRFQEDHKYLSAKLLTYFVEHPLIFVGYRADDPNIKTILYDVDRMVRADFQLVPNIYILEWDKTIAETSYPARDKVISVAPDVNIRIKSISANSFKWVFEAFGQAGDLEKINTKLLRALLARAVDLVRSDIPKKHVEINFEMLEHAVESGANFAKLFGVTSVGDPSKINLTHKYVISDVAARLEVKGWHIVNKLMAQVAQEKGVNIKAFDNRYHVHLKFGQAETSKTHKYSEALIDLLKHVMKGEHYTVDTSEVQVPKDAAA